jgi:hypothetical protein
MKIATIATAALLGAAASVQTGHASDPAALFERLTPVGRGELAGASGRAGFDQDTANLANVHGNLVGSNSVTGSNSISGSLSGNAGVTTVFQNTGNNSVFQSATSITINMR